MELCKNGKGVKMDLAIIRRNDGIRVAVVKAAIPIDKMDDPNAWWVFGVNAFLHGRRDSEGRPFPTHNGERVKYSASPIADFETRRTFVTKALKHRAEMKALKTAWRKARTKPPSRGRKYQLAGVGQSYFGFSAKECPRCHYLDPQAAFGVKCPQCDSTEE